MKSRLAQSLPVVLLCLFISLTALADTQVSSQTIRELAGIISNLNHHPSFSEKQRIMEIIKDPNTTSGMKVLAKALINMEHKVSLDDKKKLNEVIHDNSTSPPERELAEILIGINHKPSADDLKRLSQLK